MGGGGWGAVAQIGTDIASSALQAHLSLKMQQRAFTQQNRFFKQRYQRTMVDMRKAGLNPILAYRQGAGSGAPAAGGGGIGGTPQGVRASIHSGLKFKTEMKILKAQKDQIESDTFRNYSQAHQAGAMAQTTDEIRAAQVQSAVAEARRKRAGLPMLEADRDFYGTPAGKWFRFGERVKGLINPFSGKSARPGGR